MNERQIKTAFCTKFALKPNLAVVEELPVCGHSARADLVTIGETLSGYEIKSDRDSLSRLPYQIYFYDQVFERSTLIASERHLVSVLKILPAHWGIIRVCENVFERFSTEREASPSPNLSTISILELLWTNELLNIVGDQGWEGTRKSWGRRQLRTFIAANLTPQAALEIASTQMKLRRHWRAA